MILAGAMTVHRGAKYYQHLMVDAFVKILEDVEAAQKADACETETD